MIDRDSEGQRPTEGPWQRWLGEQMPRFRGLAGILCWGGAIITALLWTLGLVPFRLILFWPLLAAFLAGVAGISIALTYWLERRTG